MYNWSRRWCGSETEPQSISKVNQRLAQSLIWICDFASMCDFVWLVRHLFLSHHVSRKCQTYGNDSVFEPTQCDTNTKFQHSNTLAIPGAGFSFPQWVFPAPQAEPWANAEMVRLVRIQNEIMNKGVGDTPKLVTRKEMEWKPPIK